MSAETTRERCRLCDRPIMTEAEWRTHPSKLPPGLCRHEGAAGCAAVDWRARAIEAEDEARLAKAEAKYLRGEFDALRGTRVGVWAGIDARVDAVLAAYDARAKEPK